MWPITFAALYSMIYQKDRGKATPLSTSGGIICPWTQIKWPYSGIAEGKRKLKHRISLWNSGFARFFQKWCLGQGGGFSRNQYNLVNSIVPNLCIKALKSEYGMVAEWIVFSSKRFPKHLVSMQLGEMEVKKVKQQLTFSKMLGSCLWCLTVLSPQLPAS